MTNRTEKYCADREALQAMSRDGLGWGHDLECGSIMLPRMPRRPGLVRRIWTTFKKEI